MVMKLNNDKIQKNTCTFTILAILLVLSDCTFFSEHQRRVSSRMKFEHPSKNNDDQKAEEDHGGNSFSASDDAETSAS